jgi:hypothetical protein
MKLYIVRGPRDSEGYRVVIFAHSATYSLLPIIVLLVDIFYEGFAPCLQKEAEFKPTTLE